MIKTVAIQISKTINVERATTIADAVRLGGDFWCNDLEEGTLRSACVRNRITGKLGETLREEMMMERCVKYGRRA